jgi:hypothetical protein
VLPKTFTPSFRWKRAPELRADDFKGNTAWAIGFEVVKTLADKVRAAMWRSPGFSKTASRSGER